MTADQHTRIGRILGIPDCCIEAFNTQTQMYGEAVQRGPCRTPDECAEVDRAIQEISGDPTWTTSDDPRRSHVPCRECYLLVFLGRHPDGWVFAEDHDKLCDQDHRAHPENLLPYLTSLKQKELSIS